jgi:DNA-binding transcriptional LysR family regulator
MNMDLRSLKHVVVLARLLSYTKAAQELCITQSALSRSIQAIERHAKVTLFDRDRSGVHVTTVGRDFVKRAALLLRDADDLDRVIRRSASAEIGEVAFGIGPLAAQALLPNVLPAAFAAKPELRTNVMVRNLESLLPALLKEEIELVITAESEVMKSAPLQGEFLGWFPFSLIVRAGHPLLTSMQAQSPLKAKTKQKTPQQPEHSYPVLSPGQFSGIDGWPAYFQRYLTGPLHLIEDYGVASRITEFTDAIWLSSTFAAMFEIRAGRLAEIAPPKGQKPFRFKMMMYSLNRRSLSPAAVLLKEMFQQQFSELTAHSAS